MKTRSKICFGRTSGVTLVEVMAGLALLGTLLVSMVLARGRLLEQKIQATRTLDAAAVAERVLAEWWQDPAAIPVGESGEIEGEGLLWRTERRGDVEAKKSGAQVVRLELRRKEAGATQPLLQLEFALPLPEEERLQEGE